MDERHDDVRDELVKAVKVLKEALLKATPKWRGQFLNFATATSRAVPGLKIGVAGRKDGLPTASTCDNKVVVPLDAVGRGAQEGELVRRLDWAMSGSEGAGIHEVGLA